MDNETRLYNVWLVRHGNQFTAMAANLTFTRARSICDGISRQYPHDWIWIRRASVTKDDLRNQVRSERMAASLQYWLRRD